MGNTDTERHLDLLALFHYIFGGISILFWCFPLIHLVVGILMASGKLNSGPGGPPMEIGWIFIALGGGMFLVGQALSICTIISGRRLKSRRSYIFSVMIAGIICLLFPLGTVLGVFTIIVLAGEKGKKLYGR